MRKGSSVLRASEEQYALLQKRGSQFQKPLKLRLIEPTELEIQDSIIDGLKWHPMVDDVWRVNVCATLRDYKTKGGLLKRSFVRSVVSYSRSYGKREVGFSDLIVFLKDSRAIFMEVKRRNEVPDEDQEEFLRHKSPNSGVVRSYEDALQLLTKVLQS